MRGSMESAHGSKEEIGEMNIGHDDGSMSL